MTARIDNGSRSTGIVWSNDGAKLFFEGITSPEAMTITVGVTNKVTSVFELMPLPDGSGSYYICLGLDDVIETFSDKPDFFFEETLGSGDATVIYIAAANASGESVQTSVTGLPGSRNSEPESFATLRDRVTGTYRGAVEYLSFTPGSSANVAWLYAEVWFDDQPPVSVRAGVFNRHQGTAKFIIFRVTLEDIEAIDEVKAVLDGGSHVSAYDLRVESGMSAVTSGYTKLAESRPHRFVVWRPCPRFKCFVFRNGYGVPDTLNAFGSSSVKTEGETASFTNDRTETELQSQMTEKRTVSSGWLHGAREKAAWMDFLRSSQRYVIEDGEPRRIIVDDFDAALNDFSAGKVSFTWHYAELRRTMPAPDNGGLEPYDYATASQNKGSALLGYGIASSIEP